MLTFNSETQFTTYLAEINQYKALGDYEKLLVTVKKAKECCKKLFDEATDKKRKELMYRNALNLNSLEVQCIEKLKEQGKEGLNPRYFRQKATSYVGIGGSDWACRVETDHAMLSLSPGWKVINNDYFSWSKDVIMQDDKVERMKEIGRNLVEAAQYIIDNNVMIPGSENLDLWKGEEGGCPHCHGNNFYIFPGTNHAVCELCGLEGHLELTDNGVKLVNDPELGENGTIEHCHDLLSGKAAHGKDIFENEGRLMNLFKDPEFKARKEHYTSVIEPTPSPSKNK
jgi:hypothetical protein